MEVTGRTQKLTAILNGFIAKDFIFTLFISIVSTWTIVDIRKKKNPKDL